MFSVYGMQGQLFRGSMEQLRQVGGVDALTRARRVLATGQEGRDALAESSGAFVESEANKLASAAVGADESRRSPLSAYTDTRAGSTARQPLTRVSHVMSAQIITIKDSATVLQAWQILSEKGVGQAPVVDATDFTKVSEGFSGTSGVVVSDSFDGTFVPGVVPPSVDGVVPWAVAVFFTDPLASSAAVIV